MNFIGIYQFSIWKKKKKTLKKIQKKEKNCEAWSQAIQWKPAVLRNLKNSTNQGSLPYSFPSPFIRRDLDHGGRGQRVFVFFGSRVCYQRPVFRRLRSSPLFLLHARCFSVGHGEMAFRSSARHRRRRRGGGPAFPCHAHLLGRGSTTVSSMTKK